MRYVKGILIVFIVFLILFNQVHILHAANMLGQNNAVATAMGKVMGWSGSDQKISGNTSLKDVDLSQVKSTAQGVAAIFPIKNGMSSSDVVAMMMPKGMPEYGTAMGVSFDDPIGSLTTLSKAQPTLLAGLTPDQKARFIKLASQPLGISCEYCCSVGTVGITPGGTSGCGCQHNPALLSVGMWLIQNTNYSDAEVLREVYRWKTLFFPQKMVELGTKIAGGDSSVLNTALPGQVGGC